MFLSITLADVANRTIFSDRIPESASLLIFASTLIATAVIIRKVLGKRDVEARNKVTKN
jgi:hypothetical protein